MDTANSVRFQRFLILAGLLVFVMVLLPGTSSTATTAAPADADSQTAYTVLAPVVIHRWPPLPEVPSLSPINNVDQDNYYVVSWPATKNASAYILEESTDPEFTAPLEVYHGPEWLWYVSYPGKYPGIYYYRLKAANSRAESEWSSPQSVTIYPLFMGLRIRWDAVGYVRGEEYYDIGVHWTNQMDLMTEADTIRSNNQQWYDPNPLDFEPEAWFSYYSVITGQFKGSSNPGDPSWKWGYGWFLSYDYQPMDGETIEIDGEDFHVTGPHQGITSFGISIWYWEFVNEDRILYYDDGAGLKQYVFPGEAILRYDAGSSRLLIHSDVRRTFYYQGDELNLTVQYIDDISSATSIPGSPPMPLSPAQVATRDHDHPELQKFIMVGGSGR